MMQRGIPDMSVENYACKNCGASLTYNIEAAKWKCEFCQSEFDKQQMQDGSRVVSGVRRIEDDSSQSPEMDEYVCKNCGSAILSEGNVAATFCLYCKSPAILKSRFSGAFKPRYIIPFKVTPEQAQSKYFEWIKKRFFAPSSFKAKKEIDSIRGLYAPYWLFDCRASGFIEGEGRSIRSWRSGDYEITETKHYYVKRAGLAQYERIPVDGSKYLKDELMEGVEPFDFSEIEGFALEYMAGFFAEKYDLDESEAFPFMQARAKDYLLDSLASSGEHYDSFTRSADKASVHDVSAAYAMMPVYILTNLYNKKPHTFILNAQTGKIYGETPIDRLKQLVFFLCVYAAVLAVSVLIGGFINGLR